MDNIYIAIDLKSFYASVECADRNLDPMTTNLVVADDSRTNKTICLAVSPSLKSLGIKGRPRLFEVEQKIKEINQDREYRNAHKEFTKKSTDIKEINSDINVKVDYIIAPPQMAKYVDISADIYKIYLKWISKDDIHVYSIDEVFIDATHYLNLYDMTAKELAKAIILDVLNKTNITATAGIGSNLYLAKVAMDIVAKHKKADKYGTRIADINEYIYRKKLWNHKPITDFWRIGAGYKKRLEKLGIYTMKDIAIMSIKNEDILYKIFGINAEILIDHAWGYEPTRIIDIKSYLPKSKGISSGQVLYEPYTHEKARTIVIEMSEGLALQLTSNKMLTNNIYLSISYDKENLLNEEIAEKYNGEIKMDSYGRMIPKKSRGTYNFDKYTSSIGKITNGMLEIFDTVSNKNLLIRKISMSANSIISENEFVEDTTQLNIFDEIIVNEDEKKYKNYFYEKEKKLQETILDIKLKYGKNSILKGTNFLNEATMRKRNEQIGGHKA